MSATYAELTAKYNAEEVGDRLIAIVDGQKQYIANKEPGGGFSLTHHGLMLESQITDAAADAEPAAEKKATKRKKAAEDTPADDDLLAGLDAAE